MPRSGFGVLNDVQKNARSGKRSHVLLLSIALFGVYMLVTSVMMLHSIGIDGYSNDGGVQSTNVNEKSENDGSYGIIFPTRTRTESINRDHDEKRDNDEEMYHRHDPGGTTRTSNPNPNSQEQSREHEDVEDNYGYEVNRAANRNNMNEKTPESMKLDMTQEQKMYKQELGDDEDGKISKIFQDIHDTRCPSEHTDQETSASAIQDLFEEYYSTDSKCTIWAIIVVTNHSYIEEDGYNNRKRQGSYFNATNQWCAVLVEGTNFENENRTSHDDGDTEGVGDNYLDEDNEDTGRSEDKINAFKDHSHMYYFTREDQAKWRQNSVLKAFMEVNDCGRDDQASFKNIGYLFAILHGSQYIVELDDVHDFLNIENTTIWNTMTNLNSRLPIDEKEEKNDKSKLSKRNYHETKMEVSVVVQGKTRFNPFPLLLQSKIGGKRSSNPEGVQQHQRHDNFTVIPRGFPPENQYDVGTYGIIAYHQNISFSPRQRRRIVKKWSPGDEPSIYSLGVLQFIPTHELGHHVYDPEAIKITDDEFHLETGNNHNHSSATRRTSSQSQPRPLLVPSHSYAPYYMHSVIHSQRTFWSLLLPASLADHLVDVRRSYFAQCLFPDIGLKVAFASVDDGTTAPEKNSSVKRKTRMHSYSREASSRTVTNEHLVYANSDPLLEFLSSWDCRNNVTTVPARMECLWMDLYEKGYIQANDIKLLQLWLTILCQIGYEFPPLVKRRHRNVAVMGHFNYASSPTQVDDVLFWTQKYREWFETVVVSGPFKTKDVDELKRHGITAFKGELEEDGGFYQVTDNLKNVLKYFRNDTRIEGVMYFHDDGLVNVTDLSRGEYPFPTHDIIGNYRDQRYDPSYADIRAMEDRDMANKFSYRIFPNGTVCDYLKTRCHPNVVTLYRELPLEPWGMTTRGYCSGAQQSLAGDEEIFPYHERDGSLLFSSFTQSDFLFIPTKYADEFAKLASLFLKHRVIHECAWGTIVDMLRQHQNATVRLTYLCTSWGPKRRGKKPLIERCMRDRVDYGVFHPYKIGYEENGYAGYSWALDVVQGRY